MISNTRFLTILLVFTLVTLGAHHYSNRHRIPPRLVAHAGGEIHGVKNSNSFEALQYNYRRGFRWFELDVNLTSDGVPVVIYDWSETAKQQYNLKGRVSYDTFLTTERKDGFSKLTVARLENWLNHHSDARIITDVKNNNLKALKYIGQNHAEIQDQMIPQTYSFQQFHAVKKMDFPGVILTLYRSDYPHEQVIDFVKSNEPTAVVMPVWLAAEGLSSKLSHLDTFVYVHTVDDPERVNILDNHGVDGYYTNSLDP